MNVKRQQLQELFQKRYLIAESKEERQQINEWAPLIWTGVRWLAPRVVSGVVSWLAADKADEVVGSWVGDESRLSNQAWNATFGDDEPTNTEVQQQGDGDYSSLYTPTNTEPSETGDSAYKNDKPEVKLNTTSDNFNTANAGFKMGQAVAPLAMIGGAGLLTKALMDKKKKKKKEDGE